MNQNALQEKFSLQAGRYHIMRVLGQGGFGITYLAEQTMLKKKVAIKEFFIRDLCARDDTATVYMVTQSDMVERYRQKFIKEAQMIAHLKHPNIVNVSDIFEENGTVYYVLEYVEGESLAEKVNRDGPLPEQTALNYISKVAKALDYLHSSHVNHLDIKPANIMVRKVDDEPIIIDFGISKQYDEQKDQTTTTPPGVSTGYSPLEQYMSGGVSTFSPQADIYALGATLYDLLTGSTPPNASDILSQGFPDMPTNMSPNVIMTIEKAMQPKSSDRPQSISEFMGMMEFYQQSETAEDDEPTKKFSSSDNKEETTVISQSSPTQFEITEKQLSPVIQNLINNMVFVEGGTFTMGATPEQGNGGLFGEVWKDEKPVHQVTLSSFYIGRYEVTQEEWCTVMGSNPSKFKGGKLPVEQVSWNDCQEFICKLNAITGKSFRLPTEAEWEFAARGGNSSRGFKYAGGNDIESVAWYTDNSGRGTLPVGLKKPNELGLYDMAGNVRELCSDRKGRYSSSSQINPIGASSGSLRVNRGGGWNSNAWGCRVSYRSFITPDYRLCDLGLRLAL